MNRATVEGNGERKKGEKAAKDAERKRKELDGIKENAEQIEKDFQGLEEKAYEVRVQIVLRFQAVYTSYFRRFETG